MNIRRSLCAVALLAVTCATNASGEDSLDSLLPPPFWFRSHAEELEVDVQTRARIEATYKSLEPKYHELKARVEDRTKQLYDALVADELVEKTIVERMKALLEAENELKLHQVHVRISLLSMVFAEQRRKARELASRNPEPNFRKVLVEKVERVRLLGERVKVGGGSLLETERQLQQAEKAIADGSAIEGARLLDRIIRRLESELEKSNEQRREQK